MLKAIFPIIRRYFFCIFVNTSVFLYHEKSWTVWDNKHTSAAGYHCLLCSTSCLVFCASAVNTWPLNISPSFNPASKKGLSTGGESDKERHRICNVEVFSRFISVGFIRRRISAVNVSPHIGRKLRVVHYRHALFSDSLNSLLHFPFSKGCLEMTLFVQCTVQIPCLIHSLIHFLRCQILPVFATIFYFLEHVVV